MNPKVMRQMTSTGMIWIANCLFHICKKWVQTEKKTSNSRLPYVVRVKFILLHLFLACYSRFAFAYITMHPALYKTLLRTS